MNDDQMRQVATEVYNDLGTQFGVAKIPAHVHNGVDTNLLPIASISGYFPQVTTTPTTIPNQFSQYFATDTTTGRIYYYDFTNKQWRSSVALTSLSATSPIQYDNTTGVISTLPQTVSSYSLAETITAGQPVALGPYATDYISLDAQAIADSIAVAGSVTVSFSVASNSNRALIVYVLTSASASGVAAAYNGTSMTSAFTAVAISGGWTLFGFKLAAPTTGSHNLVISGLLATEEIGYSVYSYYNVDQTTPVAQAPTTTVASGTVISQTVTPNNDGSVLLSAFIDNTGSGAITYTAVNMVNNAQSQIPVATNASLITGDSYKCPNKAPVTVSMTKSASAIALALATLEIKAASTVSFRVYKASAQSLGTLGWNTPWKANGFKGFLLTSGVLGDSRSVSIVGVDTGQTSLTPGSDYYLSDTPGAIQTTVGTVTKKVGNADSLTSISIKQT